MRVIISNLVILCFIYHATTRKKKNTVNKNQGWEPIHQKYKASENTSRHNPKKKQKQTSTSVLQQVVETINIGVGASRLFVDYNLFNVMDNTL